MWVDLNDIYSFFVDFPEWHITRSYENEILITNNYFNQSDTIFNPDTAYLGYGNYDYSLIPNINPKVFLPIRLEALESYEYDIENGILTIHNTNGYYYILNGKENTVDVSRA